jgi:transcription-repair coupling factor (superfamily II helicase)
MSLESVLSLLSTDASLRSLANADENVIAIPEAARAMALASVARVRRDRFDNSIVVAIAPSATEAERIVQDCSVFLGEGAAVHFPAWETLPFERVSPNVETMGTRMRILHELRARDNKVQLVIAPIRSVLQRLSPHTEDVEPLVIKRGDVRNLDDFVRELVLFGYRREYQVEHRGEFSVRGSIVDIYPSTANEPVRCDFWGDEVDRLTTFSVSDQRSKDDREEVSVFAAREVLPTADVRRRAEELFNSEKWAESQWEQLANGNTFDGMESLLPWLVSGDRVLLDLLNGDDLVVLFEPRRLRDRAQEIHDEEAALASTLAETWNANDTKFPSLHVDFEQLLANSKAKSVSSVTVPETPDTPKLNAMVFDGKASGVENRVQELINDQYALTIFADGSGSAARMSESLAEEQVVVPNVELAKADITKPGARIVVESLERGAIFPSLKLALITEAEITGRRKAHRAPQTRRRSVQAFFEDLKPGDYVVHYHHGVARFAGMVTRRLGDSERDYLLLEYRGDDKLYIPSDQIDAIRAYTGGDAPSLSRLGGVDWARTKDRVRKAVREIAQELLVIYQKRVHAPGHAFGGDTPWQYEMEAAFPYQETPDQLTAIRDVKVDMEAARPMDRLVCGDVGFGKTEVAMRAAFKAVQDGKQVAILVPTTLLAQQHFQTFSERYAGFPVRVEVLSRFLTQAQARKVTSAVAEGKVDVLIGTHRLLSGDVKFKDLGLLVIDEEQRFGVMHKEVLKKLRADIDVLTLTATPIPRTLEMSLTGIRDLSLLNTPPAERQPILTYVGEQDERAISEAVRRELLREGQVFFVHNRVRDIDHVAERLRELVPEARIAVAHGQMDEGSLERIVLDFWEGKYDVLVCTTIIESGIDMPTVNTLVVDRADLLGLGQLHQLRGRVGRAGQRAYAYLFFPIDKTLTEEAFERLRTIGEHTELGSGFKIAMRDLEIRGAGNLLSGDQSGHIAAVGYDLYVQMVNESISELQGVEPKEPAEIKLDLAITAYLPSDYIAKEDLRLDAYRRIASVASQEDVEDIRREWIDRYGPLPEQAEALLRVGRLRAHCVRLGINDVSTTRKDARISPVEMKSSEQIRLQRIAPRALYKEEMKQLVVPLARGVDTAEALTMLLSELFPVEEDAQLASSRS